VSLCEMMCRLPHMATNLDLDPALLARALAVSGEKTKKAAVTRALEEFIARREQVRVEELFDQLEWDADFDYKAERSRS
jgi:Arc/MetJ family transcription regulator